MHEADCASARQLAAQLLEETQPEQRPGHKRESAAVDAPEGGGGALDSYHVCLQQF